MTDITDFLRPPRLDVENLDNRFISEWTHWRVCFENFLHYIYPNTKNTMVSYNSGSVSPQSKTSFQLLVNHVSARIYKRIAQNAPNDDYRSTMAYLEQQFQQPPPTDLATEGNGDSKEIALSNNKSLQVTSSGDGPEVTKKVFEELKNGQTNVVMKLIRNLEAKKLNVLIESRDRHYRTLLQRAIMEGHEEVACQLLEAIGHVKVDQLPHHKDHKSELIAAAETFIHSSIPKISDFLSNPEAYSRALILVISYAFNFVAEYKKHLSGKLVDTDIVIVNALLEALEFDERCSKFSTMEQGRGLLYYDLAKLTAPEEVEFLVNLLECNAIAPVKRFLDMLKTRDV